MSLLDNPIMSAIGAVIAPITTIVNGWQSRKSAQLTNDLAIAQAQTQAKISLAANAQAGDIAWDQEALTVSGWKSGYLTIILSIPLVLCFVPPMVPYINEGFAALGSAPAWYRYAIGVMMAADFGMKKAADIIGSFKK